MRTGSLRDDVADHGLVACLSAMGFATGLLDAFSIPAYLCFLANQTGNSILIYVGAFGLIEHIRFINVCVSLGSFLISCMVGGQLGNHFGRKRRWWLLTTHSIQTLALVLVSILLGTGSINNITPSRLTSVVLLSGSVGLQVAMARGSGILEVPTAMLTTPYGDLLVDPELFKFGRSRSRDRRLFYIACIWLGGATGAALYKYTDALAPLYFAAAIKFVITIVILFLPQEKGRRRSSTSSSPAMVELNG